MRQLLPFVVKDSFNLEKQLKWRVDVERKMRGSDKGSEAFNSSSISSKSNENSPRVG